MCPHMLSPFLPPPRPCFLHYGGEGSRPLPEADLGVEYAEVLPSGRDEVWNSPKFSSREARVTGLSHRPAAIYNYYIPDTITDYDMMSLPVYRTIKTFRYIFNNNKEVIESLKCKGDDQALI